MQLSFHSLHNQFQKYCLAMVSVFLKVLRGSCTMHNTPAWAGTQPVGNDGPQQVSMLRFACHRKSLRVVSLHQKKRLDPSRDSISQDFILEPAIAVMLSPISFQNFSYVSRRARGMGREDKVFQMLGKQAGNVLNFHFYFTFSGWIHA